MLAKARIVDYDHLQSVIIMANVITIVKSMILNVYSTGQIYYSNKLKKSLCGQMPQLINLYREGNFYSIGTWKSNLD